MMETIAILFIFFLLVFVGLIFFTNIAKSNVSEKLEKFQELSQIQTAQIVSSLPELQCSQENIVKENCIDLLKLQAASSIIPANMNDYFDLFGFSKITVQQIFPNTQNRILYEKVPTEYTSKVPTFFPISLYDPKDENHYFGVLNIEVYS